MSHITHLYHLAALDYINTSNLGPTWSPSFTASDMLSGTDGSTGAALVGSYVAALGIRAKCHTMGALLSGRQPISNAMVPGGVTTMLSTSGEDTATNPGPYTKAVTISKFSTMLDTVRDFINKTYIPDVLTVAAAYGGGIGMKNYFAYGTGHGNLLSYGDYLLNPSSTGTNKRLLGRGRIQLGNVLNPPTSLSNAGVYGAVDAGQIVEYVGHSHYKTYYGTTPGTATAGKNPFDGETNPQFEKNTTACGTSYSWMKAPRYLAQSSDLVGGGHEKKIDGTPYADGDPIPYEVGPLARMVVAYGLEALVGGTPTVSPLATPGSGVTVRPLEITGGPLTSSYNVKQLVDAALVIAAGGSTVAEVALLWSVLGRHAARALEAKFVADAMSGWVNDLANDNGPVYTYQPLPGGLRTGIGLVEAPRGALGHWIKIEKKRILKYQCVVPSTWNCSPKDDVGQRGAAEETIYSAKNITTGLADPTSPTSQAAQDAVVNILRLLHPFDFCGACAVHIVTPEGKTVAKVDIDPNGKVTKIE